MQHFLMPAIGAVAAGGTAMLASGNMPVAAGAAFGCAFGIWLVQSRKKAPPG